MTHSGFPLLSFYPLQKAQEKLHFLLLAIAANKQRCIAVTRQAFKTNMVFFKLVYIF